MEPCNTKLAVARTSHEIANIREKRVGGEIVADRSQKLQTDERSAAITTRRTSDCEMADGSSDDTITTLFGSIISNNDATGPTVTINLPLPPYDGPITLTKVTDIVEVTDFAEVTDIVEPTATFIDGEWAYVSTPYVTTNSEGDPTTVGSVTASILVSGTLGPFTSWYYAVTDGLHNLVAISTLGDVQSPATSTTTTYLEFSPTADPQPGEGGGGATQGGSQGPGEGEQRLVEILMPIIISLPIICIIAWFLNAARRRARRRKKSQGDGHNAPPIGMRENPATWSTTSFTTPAVTPSHTGSRCASEVAPQLPEIIISRLEQVDEPRQTVRVVDESAGLGQSEKKLGCSVRYA